MQLWYEFLLRDMILFLLEEDMQGKTEEEIEMIKLMGFGSFDSTKVRAHGRLMLCSQKGAQFIPTASFKTIHITGITWRFNADLLPFCEIHKAGRSCNKVLFALFGSLNKRLLTIFSLSILTVIGAVMTFIPLFRCFTLHWQSYKCTNHDLDLV